MKKLKKIFYLTIIGNIIGFNNSYYNDDDIKNKLNLNKNYKQNAIFYTRQINIDFWYLYGGYSKYDISNKKTDIHIIYFLSFLDTYIEHCVSSSNQLQNNQFGMINENSNSWNSNDIDKIMNSYIDNLNIYLKKYNLQELNYQKLKTNSLSINYNHTVLLPSIVIGLLYFDNNIKLNNIPSIDLKNIIKLSFYISKTINNNYLSCLGSIALTLIVSYAINNIDINKWFFELLDVFKNTNIIDDIVKEYLGMKSQEKNNININDENDIKYYMNQNELKFSEYIKFKETKKQIIFILEKYIKFRFDENNNNSFKYYEFMKFPDLRILYYFENFTEKKDIENKEQYISNIDEDNFFNPGFSIFDCLIIAIDSLIECKDNYELLIIYTMLFIGNTSVCGSIASTLYGILYEFKNIPKNLYKNDFQFKNDLISKLKNLNY